MLYNQTNFDFLKQFDEKVFRYKIKTLSLFKIKHYTKEFAKTHLNKN